MIDDEEAQSSRTSAKPNSSRRPQHDLRAQAREVRRAGRGGAEEVQDEVAVGDAVDRVRDDAREPELARPPAAGRSGSSRPPARPSPAAAPPSSPAPPRSAPRRAGTSRSTPAGGATDRPAARAGGACSPASPSPGAPRRRARSRSAGRCSASIARSACARVNIAMSVATWSLRERAVCSLPPTAPTISVSRRSTAMWMSSSESRNGNSPASSSAATRSSPPSSSSRSESVMMPAAASMVAWARDCSTS